MPRVQRLYQLGEALGRPALARAAGRDVHRYLEAGALRKRIGGSAHVRRVRHQAQRWDSSGNAETRCEREDALDLVQPLRARRRNRPVEHARRAPAAVRETNHLARRQPAREPRHAWYEIRRRKDHRIQAHAAQAPQHREARAKYRQCTLPSDQVLELGVGHHGVEIRIAVEHRGVVAVRQDAEPALREALAQGAQERRGAHQVADVVAADDENSHG